VIPDPGPERRLRADARRNHEQLLAAARDVVVERGAGAPLEEVARRAGVGIGTLYRRFPDRTALLRAVVVDALQQSSRAAEEALAEETDGFSALSRYMHAALEFRVSAVIPVVLDSLDLQDEEVGAAREASAALVQRIVDAANADGSLPEDITFGDVGTVLVRLSRPLPGPVPPEVDARLAHRHLDLFLAGMRAGRDARMPGGPGLERSDLRALGQTDADPQG
jgi:AcrR family transcriptional regulator